MVGKACWTMKTKPMTNFQADPGFVLFVSFVVE